VSVNVLVVHAHPDPDSFSAALRARAEAGLTRAGHQVTVLDLYRLGYNPTLSAEELRSYESLGGPTGATHPDPMVADHLELLGQAQALVFVYPTWWQGLPAMLKGWLDRTLLPGVAFTLDRSDPSAPVKVRPGLTNVRRLVGITTYGSGPLEVRLLGDGGRRTVTRSVRLLCHRRCRTTWLGLHRLDTVGPDRRAAFLDQVDDAMSALR
jgi:putative NADPH-quinone reductase